MLPRVRVCYVLYPALLLFPDPNDTSICKHLTWCTSCHRSTCNCAINDRMNSICYYCSSTHLLKEIGCSHGVLSWEPMTLEAKHFQCRECGINVDRDTMQLYFGEQYIRNIVGNSHFRSIQQQAKQLDVRQCPRGWFTCNLCRTDTCNCISPSRLGICNECMNLNLSCQQELCNHEFTSNDVWICQRCHVRIHRKGVEAPGDGHERIIDSNCRNNGVDG